MKSLLGTILIGILLFCFGHTFLYSIDSQFAATFPETEHNNSIIHFSQQNNLPGLFLWRDNVILNSPVSITMGNAVISGCTQQLQGFYYSDQRGLVLWPLDTTSLTALQGLNSSYMGMQLTGGLYSNCSNVPPHNVYGAIGNIWGDNTYRLLAGVDFNFSTAQRVATFSGSFTKRGSIATGWIFDSQGGIGQIVGGSGSLYPLCGNGIIEIGEQCDGGPNCTQSCTLQQSPSGGGSAGGGMGSYLTPDYCPHGDFSPSYYDGRCTLILQDNSHGSALDIPSIITHNFGSSCKYGDAAYLENGAFTDTVAHRGLPYIEIMRLSCLHKGKGSHQGLWVYYPEDFITKAEVLKTVIKMLDITFDNFPYIDESIAYTGEIPFVDVAPTDRFAHYAYYAYIQGLTEGLYTTDRNGNMFLDPYTNMSRYDAIKTVMQTYNKIVQQPISGSTTTLFADITEADPYYYAIIQAESLGLISGIKQENGKTLFNGNSMIKRAEFAKIFSLGFSEYLMNIDGLVHSSNLYTIILHAVSQTQSNKLSFINNVFNVLSMFDDTMFRNIPIDKTIFLQILKKVIIRDTITILQQSPNK